MFRHRLLVVVVALIGLTGLAAAMAQDAAQGGDARASSADGRAQSTDSAGGARDARAETTGAAASETGTARGAARRSAAGGDNARGGSERTMRNMMKLRKKSPAINPVTRPQARSIPSRAGAPAPRVDFDRSVLGVAPGEKAPKLRREGTFIVNRRARMVRSPDGAHELLVFEADSKATQEQPMILQACRLLETMENIVQKRGDRVQFIVSGQIHTYRGANYLLPTMMKIAIDRGNLQN